MINGLKDSVTPDIGKEQVKGTETDGGAYIYGEAVRKFVEKHRLDDVRELALRGNIFSGIDKETALRQIAGWQIARKKLPLWAETEGVAYPCHLSMEQCSSQMTAEYKRDIINGEHGSMADLTGGFGVDCTVIGRTFERVTFVERNAELCELARRNLPLLGVASPYIICEDCVAALAALPHHDFLMIDPARRDANGARTVSIAGCTPDVSEINDLLLEKATTVLVKLSPMLDLQSVERDLKGVSEVHIVSVGGECKEILALLRKDAADGGSVRYHCVNIVGEAVFDISYTKDEERRAACHYAATPGAYLYEPNASIMKGGGFKTVAQRYGLEKLHPNSHLYTSDSWVDGFPGRAFAIKGWTTFSKQGVRKMLGGVKKANVAVRNFPETVQALRKRLGLADGGSLYLFATTLADNTHALVICEKVEGA